jgi:hypothetical protein
VGKEAAKKKSREKQTMHKYFSSSRNPSNAMPLHVVLDSSMPDVLGAEPWSSSGGQSIAPGPSKSSSSGHVSMDTGTPFDSSGDTVILSDKSPMIPLLSESDSGGSMDNAGLIEIPMGDEAQSSDEEVESPPKKKKGSKTAKSEKQKKYDRHRKFQTEWSAKLPWAEGILADDGILHMVRC